jgi:hypothetical protein
VKLMEQVMEKGHRRLTADYRLHTTDRRLQTIDDGLSTRLLIPDCWLQTADDRLLVTDC